MTQSHTNLEDKLLDRLLKAYKEQKTQLETLRQHHEDKIRDLQVGVQSLDRKMDEHFVKNEPFQEVR